MQTIQFEGVPICSMCRYKQMTYMYSVSLTTGPIHKHYPHYPDTCTLCLFMSVQFSDPHQPSAHHPQVLMGSPWLYFGLQGLGYVTRFLRRCELFDFFGDLGERWSIGRNIRPTLQHQQVTIRHNEFMFILQKSFYSNF